MWNWSPLFTLLHHPNLVTRWYVASSIQLALDVSDKNMEKMRLLVDSIHQQLRYRLNEQQEKRVTTINSTYESELLALETAIMFVDGNPISQTTTHTVLTNTGQYPTSPMDVDDVVGSSTKEIIEIDDDSESYFTKDDLSSALVDVCGILLPKRVDDSTSISKYVSMKLLLEFICLFVYLFIYLLICLFIIAFVGWCIHQRHSKI